MKLMICALAVLFPVAAVADVSPAKKLQGPTVAKDGTAAKWVFPLGKSIAIVNADGELWLHDLNGDTVAPARQVKGPPIGKDATPPRFVFAVGVATQVAVVNSKGELWVHEIRDTIQPARQILGAAIDGKYLVAPGRGMLATINDKGQLFMQSVTDKVSSPVQVPGPTIAKDGTPAKFVVGLPKGIGVINTAGELWVHEVAAQIAPAKREPGAPVAKDGAKHAFVVGSQIIVVSDSGEVFAHDLSAAPAVVAASPAPSCDLRGRWVKRYDKLQNGAVDKGATENEIEVTGDLGKLIAHYVGKEAKNKSTFALTCKEGPTTTVTIAQKDKAYESESTVALGQDGTMVGTWHDSKKNAGDIVLTRAPLGGQ